jgi:hypothetical protein
MHSDLLRVVAEQHAMELQAKAQARQQVRLARKARKAHRRGNHASDPLASVQVPDYVDGTFRTDAEPTDARHQDGATAGRPAA